MKRSDYTNPDRRKRTIRSHTGGTAREYRVTGTWPDPRSTPAVIHHKDRAQIKRAVASLAGKGAFVVVEKADGTGGWRHLYDVDGPALAADRAAAERAAQEAEDARIRAALAKQAADRRTTVAAARSRAQAAALMVQPPVPRSPSHRTARHTAGQR